jgi:redox-sensing transcriptional repressor
MDSEIFHSISPQNAPPHQNAGRVLPKAARKRLVELWRALESASSPVVTSRTLSLWTGWTRDTIRKDISLLGISCGDARGYERLALCDLLRARLSPRGNDGLNLCCVVGLGGFGESFLRSRNFGDSVFCVAAGFDRSLNRIETLNADCPLYAASRLEEVIKKLGIEYAVLCESVEHAPGTAKRLAAAGIKGIVNATSASLPVGNAVRVENISVLSALHRLSCQ